MNPKIIHSILKNFLFLIIGFFLLGIIYSYYRKSTPLFRVDIKKIEKDIKLSSKNTLENTGWPTKDFALKNLEDNRYRKSQNDMKNSCLEVYGGSYTYSFNSKNGNDSWSSKLSEDLYCSVLNYGIPGFGTDQSVIRHEKYKSKNNISILMFVDDSLKRNMFPMLGLSYDGLAKSYDKKTFKPYYKIINDDLVLVNPNPNDIARAIDKEKNKICLGPTSLICIFKEIYNNFKLSIKTKGKYYQHLAKISKPLSEYMANNIEYEKNNQNKYSLNLQIKLIKKYLSNCNSIDQICFITRFPYMRDVAFPGRILINPVEQTMEKFFKDKYISSYSIARCMKTKLGISNDINSIDLSVMKYEHPKNKHYLEEANNYFAKCLFFELNKF